jgi:hypothetical protein
MNEEELIEEILRRAYERKIGQKVIKRASELIKSGYNKYKAFKVAYQQISKDEI